MSGWVGEWLQREGDGDAVDRGTAVEKDGMEERKKRWHEEEISGRLGQCTGRHIRSVSGMG